MDRGNKVACKLCQRSDETETTGPLSTKENVTAHQNCLLFSSGICSENSPQFDDLFGFSVSDVLKEVNRGKKLRCHYCQKKGATAGCEVKRCKRSYHYPCAVKDHAETFEDSTNGHYGLYCLPHKNQLQNNKNVVNGVTEPETSYSPTEARLSKAHCLACEQVEGNIRLDNLNHSITMVYCKKHAPLSLKKKTNGGSTAAGPSVCSSDSNSSSSTTRTANKRQLSNSENPEETPSKRKSEGLNGIITDDSSNSDTDETNREIEIFAPLESDLDESANSVPEHQLIRKDNESAIGSTSGNQQEDEDKDEDENETMIHSDADSESLLVPVNISLESPVVSGAPIEGDCPVQSPVLSPVQTSVLSPVQTSVHNPVQTSVHSPGQLTNGPSVPQQSSPAPSPSPDQAKPRTVTRSPPCTSSAIMPAAPKPICVSLLSSPSCPRTALPSNSEPSIDATSFWKSCNAAGCTQAIFTEFINGMNEISSRILSDQASQEDYDLALSVMTVSGKLAELVAKQQEELERKRMELQKAAAAMKDVVSALRK